MQKENLYVWYAGYGSNLSRQRFLCYITGGKPRYGKSENGGCSDKNLPIDEKRLEIPYALYFALPNNHTMSTNWGKGGVAFIEPNISADSLTLCRMWKITEKQYEDVKKQEGPSWYNHVLELGKEGGIPIKTITNIISLNNILPPSEAYLKTIASGFKELYNFTDNKIADYLIEKKGIKGNLTKTKILKIINGA